MRSSQLCTAERHRQLFEAAEEEEGPAGNSLRDLLRDNAASLHPPSVGICHTTQLVQSILRTVSRLAIVRCWPARTERAILGRLVVWTQEAK